MKETRPMDTSIEIERIQMTIFRKMSPEDRLKQAGYLTDLMKKLLEQGVRKRHPDYSEEYVRLAVIRLLLPEKLFLAAYPHAKDILP